jgi:hypothetical protein
MRIGSTGIPARSGPPPLPDVPAAVPAASPSPTLRTIEWCDRHLAAVHTLSALITDDPSVLHAALTELLNDPGDPRATRRPPKPPATKTRPRPHTHRDLCPDGTRPADRVELVLRLMGDRTCAMVSQALHLPEHTVMGRLRTGLWVLFTPCGTGSPDR